jgi:alpha-tubulin suppressor-like RCC1 family protein
MKRSGNEQAATAGPRAAVRGLAVAAVTGLAVCALPAASWAATSGSAARPAAAPPARSLLAWGDNSAGELGNGDNSGSFAVSPVTVKLSAGTKVTAAQGSCGTGYALTAQGQLLAWGDNELGELGDGGTEFKSTVPVPVSLPPHTRITSFQAGCQHVLALTSTGKVLAWGDNFNGGLGDGGTEPFSNTPVRVKLPAFARITAVSAGRDYSLALTATGQVLAWGQNNLGTLGDGTTASSPTPVPVKLPKYAQVTAISAGVDHSLARTVSGAVLAWGDNSFRELGDGGTESISDVPVMVSLPRGTRVISVSAGLDSSMALTNSRQVLTWGVNQHGELGTSSTATDSSVPGLVRLPAGSLVTAISAGANHDVALTATGRVYNWGLGFLLGDGSGLPTATPPVQPDLPAGVPVTGIGSGTGADFTFAIVARTGR